MARVKTVQKAQKAQGTCRRCGDEIAVGDRYYWFANRIGRSSQKKKFCSKHYPKPSEMTTSDKLSRLYEVQENLGDCEQERDSLAQTLRDGAETAREVGEEYRESASNIEDGFGTRTYMCDELDEKADACDSWADEMESAADEIESLTPEDFESEVEQEDDESDEDYQSRLEDAMNEDAQSKADDAGSGLEL